MGDEVKIDKDTFNNRLSHFVSTWKGDKRQSNDALFGGVGSIVVLLGRNEENVSFQKNNAMHVCVTIQMLLSVKSSLRSLQFWLLGYEFPATLMVFTLDSLYIVTTSKKGTWQPSSARCLELISNVPAKHLEPLKGGKVPIEILVRGKDAEQNAKHFEKCLDVIKGAGVRLRFNGCLTNTLTSFRRKLGSLPRIPRQGLLRMSGRRLMATSQKRLRRLTSP